MKELDELLPDLGIFGFLIFEKEATDEFSIWSDCGRRRGYRSLYSIRYLTILIRILPVWLST